ncbi:TraC family protein [Roseibium aggregatum]|uniref:TraC family protein n=2 Tax=Hyphomicrobiales TaxID=356 RepID=UPI0009FB021A|nr:TraC family protein [Roseibium aggregatum]UFI06747.1 pilus assembly protein [Roseibium aggregatum]
MSEPLPLNNPYQNKENLMAPRNSKTASEQIDDIEAQIAKLQQKKRQVLKKQSERVAKLVMESGLAELDIDEAELAKALNDLAARFQKPAA